MNHRASFNLLTKIHTNVSLTRFYPLSNCLLFAERIGDAYLGWIDLKPLHLCSVLPNNICSPLATSVPSFLTNLHLARSTHFKGARDKNTGVQMCPIAHHRIHRMTCWYLTGEMKRQLLPALWEVSCPKRGSSKGYTGIVCTTTVEHWLSSRLNIIPKYEYYGWTFVTANGT